MSPRKKTPHSTPRLSEVARHLVVPSGITTTGWPTMGEQIRRLGLGFDRWQAGLGALILSKRADGSYACSVGGVVMSIPRQVGKTFVIGWLVFAMCLVYPGLLVVWTAHRTRTSDETFESMKSMADRPEVKPHIDAVRIANGQQGIIFANGSRILFGARERGFGRGFTKVAICIYDEAQILTEAALDDMIPATNASPIGLIIYLGTPPRPKDPGAVFKSKRADALAGDRDTLYVEFSAPEDTDVAAWPPGKVDWGAVRVANPSFPHRTGKPAVLRLRKNLSAESFRREALGIWDDENADPAPLPVDQWKALEVRELPPPEGGTCFGVRFSVDNSRVALGAAVRLDKVRTLVDGVRLEEAGSGTDWLTRFLTEPDRLRRTAQIVVDGKGGAAYLVNELRRLKVPARVIWTPSTEKIIEAHSMALAAVQKGTMVHRPGRELDREARLARKRPIGTLGGFGWAAPQGDTSALLDAVTLAHWATQTTKRRIGRKQRGLV